MKRLLILIIASGLGALLIGTWILLTLRQPTTRVVLRPPTVEAPAPKTSNDFVLHEAPSPLPELTFRDGAG